jgi:hypothetical protein
LRCAAHRLSLPPPLYVPAIVHYRRKQKEAEEQKYRDRAKERREGANPDYEEGAELRPAGFQSMAPPEGHVSPKLWPVMAQPQRS